MDKRQEFKLACENCLQSVSLTALRAYGRAVGVRNPTAMKKSALVSEIIALLCGEAQPQRNGLGAPVKDNYVEPTLLCRIDELRAEYGENCPYLLKQEGNTPDGKKLPAEKIKGLQLNVDVDTLTDEQKQKLQAFLNSL